MNMKILLFIFSVFIISNISAKEINADDLYAKAIVLYEQGKQAAFPILKQAAALGNTDAMCLLGEANNSGLMGSDEADKWYQMAADHDAACGYAHLLDSNEITDFVNGQKDGSTQEKYLDRLLDKASHNDRASMRVLSNYYGSHHQKEKEQAWGEKSAEAGDADVMRFISELTQEGNWGWYILPGAKEKAAKEWMLKSAKHGNPRAMGEIASGALAAHDFKTALFWIEKGMEIGDINSIGWLGQLYSNFQYEEIKLPELPENLRDKAKAYACYKILLTQLAPSHANYKIAKEGMEYSEKNDPFSKSDIQKGNEIAEKWMKTHQARDWSVEFGML
jgi:TPR repeat protein